MRFASGTQRGRWSARPRPSRLTLRSTSARRGARRIRSRAG